MLQHGWCLFTVGIGFVVSNAVRGCLPPGTAAACAAPGKIHPSPADGCLKPEASQRLEGCFPGVHSSPWLQCISCKMPGFVTPPLSLDTSEKWGGQLRRRGSQVHGELTLPSLSD